jgi:hypothetical protein
MRAPIGSFLTIPRCSRTFCHAPEECGKSPEADVVDRGVDRDSGGADRFQRMSTEADQEQASLGGVPTTRMPSADNSAPSPRSNSSARSVEQVADIA